MVDAFGFAFAGEGQVDREALIGKDKHLANLIAREMFRCPSSRFRVSTKVYDEHSLSAAEAWMSKQGWQFEKSTCEQNKVITYCVRK